MTGGVSRDCLSDEAIDDLVAGKLEPSAVRAIAEHIDRCAECRRVVAEVARGVDLAPSDDAAVDESAAPLPSGSVVGRYVVGECIGAGSMGIVYNARDPDLGRRVALKLLRTDPDATASRGGRARLLREAQAMAQLSHPNVITVHDVGAFGDGVFLAMELVEGGTLAEWMHGPERSWREVVAVLRRAGEGLAAAHAAGLVHRDFKPDNVLVGSDGRVRVTDFGLVRTTGDAERPDEPHEPEHLLASMTRTGTLIGTPAYMAPEQLAGAVADARSDLFSFCVTSYEALYGERPFAGSTVVEVSEAITRGALLPPSTRRRVPAWLRRTVVRGLHADPGQRQPTMRALLDAVDAGLARGRWRTAAAAMTAIVFLGGAAAATVGVSHARRATVPPASSVAPEPEPTAVTDVALPASGNAEAIRAYQSGLQRLRDGDGLDQIAKDFARAAELDPSLAAAHLRYALVLFWNFPLESRDHLARAVDGRHSLSERDQLLLGAAQAWMQSQPADPAAYARLTGEAQARFPLDAELAYWAAVARDENGDRAGATEFAHRAVALDPHFGSAYYVAGEELAYLGDTQGALAAVQDCVTHAPNQGICLGEQAKIDRVEGNCPRFGQTSQQLLARHPSDDVPYLWLANADYVQGQSLEVVRELLGQEVARQPASLQPRTDLRNQWALDVLTGDFDAALGRAHDMEQIVTSVPDRRTHARAALWRVSAATETGRSAEAGKSAHEFLQRMEAWVAEPSGGDSAISQDPTPRLLQAERQAGLLSQEDFERLRTEWIDGWAQKAPAALRPFVWLHGYASIAQTADDATRALGEQEKYGSVPRFVPWEPGDAYIGTTFFLAGRASDAIPFLRRAAASCMPTAYPFEHTQVHLVLGQALATMGQHDEACAAYGVVLARWGKAKPRSVTADQARSLARTLACPGVP
jgi:tetratricopeptide (TPR) repeat protein